MILKKKFLFLAVEFKHREFLSKLLLASFASKAGFRVYVGSTIAVPRLLSRKNLKGGIFFYKGGVDLDALLKIKKKFDHFVILDEEMGTEKIHYAKVAKRRIWPNTEKYTDRYFVIGKHGYDVSCDIFPEMKDSVRCTGWPRVDLWRKENEFLFKEKTESISKKYGNFILFASDFGYNSQKIIDDRLYAVETSNWKSLKNELSIRKEFSDNVFKEYNQFLKILKDYDKKKNCPLIIIRPHPAEDIDAWFDFSKELSNIKVIFEGEITPWINASSGLLHRGCTSTIQAHMRGLPVGYFVAEKSAIQEGTPYSISQHLFTLDDLSQFCVKAISKKNNYSPIIYHDELKKMIHIQNDKLASELIVEDLLKLETTHELPYQTNTMDLMIDIFLNIKSGIKKISKLFIKNEKNIGITPESLKIPNGITKKEAEDFLNKLDLNQKFKVKQVFKDCIEIEI